MKAEEIVRHRATPLTAPAYPAGSHRFTDREYLNVVYRTDADAFRAALPEPLQVDDPLVRFEVMRMGDVDGFGPYTECGQALTCSYDGERGEYLHAMYLDNGPATFAGREQSAYPKAFGSPAMRVEQGALIGTLMAELDRVVTGSLGPRWATGGPFLSFHLGGGPGGLRHMLEHLGPGMARRWASLGDPSLDEDTVAELVAGTEAAYGISDYTALTDARDRAEVAVLAAREAAGEKDS